VPELQILPSDIQTAMQGDERVSLRVQLAAATRRITELEAEQCQCSQDEAGLLLE